MKKKLQTFGDILPGDLLIWYDTHTPSACSRRAYYEISEVYLVVGVLDCDTLNYGDPRRKFRLLRVRAGTAGYAAHPAGALGTYWWDGATLLPASEYMSVIRCQ